MKKILRLSSLVWVLSIFGVFAGGFGNNAYASVARCGNANGVAGGSYYTLSLRRYCINSSKTLTIYGQVKNLEDAKFQTLTATARTADGQKSVISWIKKSNYISVEEYKKSNSDYLEQDGTPYKVDVDISSLPYGKLSVNVSGSWNGYSTSVPGIGSFEIDYIAQTNIQTTATLDGDRGILTITGTTKNVSAGETVTFDIEGFMMGNPAIKGSAVVQDDGTFSTTINVASMLLDPWLRQLSVVSKVKDVNGDIIQDFDMVETPPIYPCNFVENKTVQRTINYLYKDGSIAAKPTVQKIDFKRTTNGSCYRGKLVEGTYTVDDSDWKKLHTFEKVNAPEIKGYTYDKETVDELTVNVDSENIVENIIYKKNIIPKDDKIPAQEIGNKGESKMKIAPVWVYAPNTGVEKKQNSNALFALSSVILALISSAFVIRRKF